MIVLGPNKDTINTVLTEASKILSLQLIGDINGTSTSNSTNTFLGLEILRDAKNGTLTMHQEKYTKNLLSRFNKLDIRPCKTPYNIGSKLRKSDTTADPKDITLFQQNIGSLLYLSIKTRPDITYAVNRLSQYTNNPSKSHWDELDKIWGYLKKNPSIGITYKATSLKNLFLKGYSDADYANNLDNRRSTTGYLFTLGTKNLLSWNSTLQKTVALSTTEAEYMALKEASREAIYLNNLLQSTISLLRLNIPTKIPVTLIDNQSALKLSENPEFHKRTKHIDIAYHFIREVINNKML